MTDYDGYVSIFERDGWTCQTCHGSVHRYSTPQVAHRIADTKENRSKYGAKVIDHELNKVAVCSLKCNDKCNIGHKTVEANALARRIAGELSFDMAEAVLTT